MSDDIEIERDEATCRRLKLARGRAERKAAKLNAKTQASIPLFVDQVEPARADDLFRHWQLIKAAGCESAGEIQADMIWRTWKINILRRLARELLPENDFEHLDISSGKTAFTVEFWIDRLTTTKPVIMYSKGERELGPIPVYHKDEDGKRIPGTCFLVLSDRFNVSESASFPPPGWSPPMTRERLDEYLRIPPPADHPTATNPLSL